MPRVMPHSSGHMMFLLLTADHAERRWLCESHQEKKVCIANDAPARFTCCFLAVEASIRMYRKPWVIMQVGHRQTLFRLARSVVLLPPTAKKKKLVEMLHRRSLRSIIRWIPVQKRGRCYRCRHYRRFAMWSVLGSSSNPYCCVVRLGPGAQQRSAS